MENKCVRMLVLLVFCLWGVGMPCHGAAAASPQQKDNQDYSAHDFLSPSEETEKVYLGIDPQSTKFKLKDVQAEIVVVEILSMYCHYCQKLSPQMNKLYDLVAEKGLSGRVVIMGVAMSNSDFEVGVYRKKYKTAFPLIPDPKNSAYPLVGRVAIPCLVIFQKGEDGRMRKVYSNPREKRKAEKMFETIAEIGGFSEGGTV